VELGHDDLGGGDPLGGVDVDRNAASVVLDGDRAVDVDDDGDARADARERLVDGVVDDLVDEVMQAPLGGVADVHAGAFANGIEAFQDLDLVGAVRGRAGQWLALRFHR
jgi:hypothetical protein